MRSSSKRPSGETPRTKRTKAADEPRQSPPRSDAPGKSRFAQIVKRRASRPGKPPARRSPRAATEPQAKARPEVRELPVDERPARERPERPRLDAHEERQEGLILRNPALIPPLSSPASFAQPAVAGSGLERAQAAALVERMVSSMQVGTVGDARVVRLELGRSGILPGVEVLLREEDGRIHAELSGSDPSLERFAARVDEELRERGIDFAPVVVDRD